jgi:hypothetical protein
VSGRLCGTQREPPAAPEMTGESFPQRSEGEICLGASPCVPSRDGELLGLLFLGGYGIEFSVVGWPKGGRRIDAAFDSGVRAFRGATFKLDLGSANKEIPRQNVADKTLMG